MAFSESTHILTSKGWKSISEISGKDKVLVRNFLGDAEFIQPFALHKKKYEGEMVTFGGKYWSVSLTPDHKVVYDLRPDGGKQEVTYAQDIMVDKHKHLYRKFRYIREDRTNEHITIKNGDTTRQVSISDEDWYTLVAYTVTKGNISTDANPRLKFFLDMSNVIPIVDILDRWGVSNSVIINEQTIVLTVNRDNNLATKLKRHLGARARRDMELPDKMIYGSSQALMKHFLGVFTSLVAKPAQTRPNQLIFSSSNKKMLETVKMMCMFVGYGFSMTNNKGIWNCYIIPSPVSPWTVRNLQKRTYSGYVYEIDLFDGLVYVTEGTLPVWMSPK